MKQRSWAYLQNGHTQVIEGFCSGVRTPFSSQAVDLVACSAYQPAGYAGESSNACLFCMGLCPEERPLADLLESSAEFAGSAAEAVALFQAAANTNSSEGLFLLGWAHQHGVGMDSSNRTQVRAAFGCCSAYNNR